MLLILHVDDILMVENNIELIEATKKWFSFVFQMQDMGEATYGNSQKPFQEVPRYVLRSIY